MAQTSVYVKANPSCTVYDRNITLGDVLKIECADGCILRMVKQMDLYRFSHEHSVVFSILKVIERIHKDYPNVDVVNCGACDFVVAYQKSTVQNKWIEKMKLLAVSIIVFFGSAFTIMSFHTDIGIQDTFGQFYEQCMGKEKPAVTELEISYSIGLALGITIFFNHFNKKKITKDPTPIEVEMKKYNQDVTTAKVTESGERGHTVDVH